MRLAKQLIDLDLAFEQANGIASRHEVRNVSANNCDSPASSLMAWPRSCTIALARADLRHLADQPADVVDVTGLVQLDRIADHVSSVFNESTDFIAPPMSA